MLSRRILVLGLLTSLPGCTRPMRRRTTPSTPHPAEPGRPIDRASVVRLDPGAVMFLDVRTRREFARGHIPDALSVPLEEIRARTEEIRILARGRPIVVYCYDGRRADGAIGMLADAGLRNTRRLTGDYRGWDRAGLPFETAPPPRENEWQNWF